MTAKIYYCKKHKIAKKNGPPYGINHIFLFLLKIKELQLVFEKFLPGFLNYTFLSLFQFKVKNCVKQYNNIEMVFRVKQKCYCIPCKKCLKLKVFTRFNNDICLKFYIIFKITQIPSFLAQLSNSRFSRIPRFGQP